MLNNYLVIGFLRIVAKITYIQMKIEGKTTEKYPRLQGLKIEKRLIEDICRKITK
jgi:hypothetical protein